MFFASIIYSFYHMVFLNWISPETVEASLEVIEETYYNMGLSDDRIEQTMVLARKLQTPVWQVITSIAGTTFTGFIISLIVAIFIKREGDPFQSTMKGIDNTQVENE